MRLSLGKTVQQDPAIIASIAHFNAQVADSKQIKLVGESALSQNILSRALDEQTLHRLQYGASLHLRIHLSFIRLEGAGA